ncbi:hypothetical protein F5888DRAFT_934939 [Russula emetica]|nr:hypothetical protein F5888DRAFT_934939 [Russula emetica]
MDTHITSDCLKGRLARPPLLLTEDLFPVLFSIWVFRLFRRPSSVGGSCASIIIRVGDNSLKLVKSGRPRCSSRQLVSLRAVVSEKLSAYHSRAFRAAPFACSYESTRDRKNESCFGATPVPGKIGMAGQGLTTGPPTRLAYHSSFGHIQRI